MKKYVYLLIIPCLVLTSCEETGTNSTDDIVEGLKTALKVGSDSASTNLNKPDGYFKDQLVKILLPPEADIIYDNRNNFLLQGLGVTGLIDDVVLSMNRAAEDAATEAKPIFTDAITSLSISDGLAILNGENPANPTKSGSFDSTAATNYLISTTRTPLYNAFKPKINTSLGKDLGLGFSANSAWSTLTNGYNDYAPILGLAEVNSDLSLHVTNKALDGLFLKVGDQERAIRRDPLKWAASAVGAILEKVFGK